MQVIRLTKSASSSRPAPFVALLAVFWLIVVTGCTGAASEDIAESSQQLCSGVRLSANPAGPVAGSVLLTATDAVCAAGQTAEYLFREQFEGTTSWTTIQGWSASPVATWTVAAGSPSGPYSVQVLARAHGSTVTAESSRRLSLLVGSVCQAVSLTTDVASPQSLGTSITLSAAATCTAGAAEYAFLVTTPAGVVSTLSDWSVTPTAHWSTSGLSAGEYTLTVLARHSGNTSYDSSNALTFQLGETCLLPKFAISPTTLVPGANLLLSVIPHAQPACTGTATPQYRFSYRPVGAKTFETIRDWSASTNVSWSTSGLADGSYQARVEVRANDGSVTADGHRYAAFAVNTCSLLPATLSAPSPVAVGPLRITSGATCANNVVPLFRYSYALAGSNTTTLLRDFDPDPSFTWDTSQVAQTDYRIFVELRAAGFDVVLGTTAVDVTVGGECASPLELVGYQSDPATKSVHLQVYPQSPCARGEPEYRFSYLAPGSASYEPLSDWSPVSENTFSVANVAPRTKVTFRVDARAAGSQTPSQASADTTVTVGIQCDFQRSPILYASAERVVAAQVFDSCPVGLVEYQLSYAPRSATNNWTALPYTSALPLQWDTTGLPDGDYDVRVNLRAIGETEILASWLGSYSLTEPLPPSTNECVDPGCDPSTFCVGLVPDSHCGPCPPGYSGDSHSGCIPPAWSPHFVDLSSGGLLNGLGLDLFFCGLDAAGEVSCWGSNELGESTPPSGPFDRLARGGNGRSTCARRPNGTWQCWGAVSLPADFSGPTLQLASTATERCALALDGSIECLTPSRTVIEGPFTKVVAGLSGFCALRADSSVQCWNGVPTPSGQFRDIALWTEEICSQNCLYQDYGCGIRPDDTVECWNQLLPTATPMPGKFRSLERPGCGIRLDGSLWCKQAGTQGLPGGRYLKLPGRNCALREDNSLRCWPWPAGDYYGTYVPPGNLFTAVSAGIPGACALAVDGYLTCFGDDRGDYASYDVPRDAFSAVSVGEAAGCGIKQADNTLECWGGLARDIPWDHPYQSLSVMNGTGAVQTDGTLQLSNPYVAPAGAYQAVAQGRTHGCGLLLDGNVRCWGSNDFGESAPLPGPFAKLASGDHLSCGIRSNGQVECWGNLAAGVAAPPAGSYESLSLTSQFACALDLQGNAVCWGSSCDACAQGNAPAIRVGEASYPALCNACSPPSGPFVSLSAGILNTGSSYACAVRSSGELVCWGGLAR